MDDVEQIRRAFDRAIAAGDRATAEARTVQLLTSGPGAAAALHHAGSVLARVPGGAIALAALRSACGDAAAPAAWFLELAQLEHRHGNHDAALAAALRATMLDPALTAAHLLAATIHLERRAYVDAAGAYDRAIACGARGLALHVNRSVIAFEIGDLPGATDHAQAAVALDPDSIVAHVNAAMIDVARHDFGAALARLDTVTARAAGDAGFHRARAHALAKLTRFAESLAEADRALALEPRQVVAIELRVNALRNLGRDAEAAATLADLDGVERDERLLASRAVLEMERGESAAARATLRAALARNPAHAWSWFNLGEAGGFDSDGNDAAAIEALLARDATPANDRMQLSFALGKAYLACDDHARAFEHFRTGNALKRALLRFDVAHDERSMADLAREFDRTALARPLPGALHTERPVFIVGMPRSGTSLVEQLLASHPEVFGAGELLAMPAVAAARTVRPREAWASLGAAYLDTLVAGAGDAKRIVDKLPLNFLNAGLIRVLFPRARIVHCRRDPLDTAVSCYTTLFESGQEFSYDLVELGRFIRAYVKLMDHWRTVLPPDRFIEIDYEAVVADVEHESRRLLDFCGLPWDPAVLRFHTTKRAVRTASKTQVRQPIYRSSVNRSAAFGPLLDPLRAALAGISAPEPAALSFAREPTT